MNERFSHAHQICRNRLAILQLFLCEFFAGSIWTWLLRRVVGVFVCPRAHDLIVDVVECFWHAAIIFLTSESRFELALLVGTLHLLLDLLLSWGIFEVI